MSTPRGLTIDETRTYHDQGFVIAPEIYSREECAAISAEIERLEAEHTTKDAEHGGMIFSLGMRSPLTEGICEDERILTLIEDLVHPGIAIYSAKMVPKHPGGTAVCHWHQDDTYYHQRCEAKTRLSIWLALNDSDAENGGVHFLPGSHRWGQQPWFHAEEGACRLAVKDPDPERLAQAVCPQVRAGSVVIFDALTWHYSDANRSDRIRRSFIVSYQEATAACGNGEQHRILRSAPSAHAR